MNSLFIGILSFFLTSIYSMQFTDVDGNQVNMSSYQNKKILLVNIASGSPKAAQLAGLQQLHQQYGDSVTIIAFPSNSFGNESRTNAEIRQFCQSNYGVSFRIASKNSVSGADAQPLFHWLRYASENGVLDGVTGRDFQKYLIGRDGKIIGIFNASVLPMDSTVIDAIMEN